METTVLNPLTTPSELFWTKYFTLDEDPMGEGHGFGQLFVISVRTSVPKFSIEEDDFLKDELNPFDDIVADLEDRWGCLDYEGVTDATDKFFLGYSSYEIPAADFPKFMQDLIELYEYIEGEGTVIGVTTNTWDGTKESIINTYTTHLSRINHE